jgi:uncharacterized protein (DUF934 family)
MALKSQGLATAFVKLTTVLDGLPPNQRTRLLRAVVAYYEEAPEKAARSGEHPAGPVLFSEDRTMPIHEFVDEKKPKTDATRIACLAYYLSHYRDQKTFGADELFRLNKVSKRWAVANPRLALQAAVRSGLIERAGVDRYAITPAGTLKVSALPDGPRVTNIEVRTRRSSTKRRS